MSFDLEKEEQEYRQYKANKTSEKENIRDETSDNIPSVRSDFSETPYRPVLRMFSWSSALLGIFAYLFHRNQIERKKWHKNGITFFLVVGLLNIGFSFITQPSDTMTHIMESDAGWIILNLFLAFFICRKIKGNALRITLSILVWLVIQFVVSFVRGKIGFEAFTEGTTLYWIALIANFIVVGFTGQKLFNEMYNPDSKGTPQFDEIWKCREKKALITGLIVWSLMFAYYFGVGVGESSVPSNGSMQETEEISHDKQTYLIEFGIVCDDAQGIMAPDTLDDVDQVLYLHNQIILKCGANQIREKKTFDYFHLSEYTARFPQVAPSVKKYGAILYTYETTSGELAYIFAYKNDAPVEKSGANDEPVEMSDTLVLRLENEDLEKYDFLALCSDKPGLFVNIEKRRRVMDCAKYLAAEILPTLGVYKNLQEAYFAESGKIGEWSEVGMMPITNHFFKYEEIPNGIKVVVPKDIRQCRAESSWLYQAENVDGQIMFDIVEPTNKTCRNMFDVNRIKSK